MIISGAMDVLFTIFEFLTRPINIPPLPTEIQSYMSKFFDYLETGAGVLANYVPLSYFFILFGVILAVDVGVQIYHFIMWLIRKIPFLGMS